MPDKNLIKHPMLPLRDVVVYPQLVIPLFVGRDKSIKAIEEANKGDKKILLVAQKTAGTDEPNVKDLYTIGTVATILQMLKLPDGTVKVLVEGTERAEIDTFKEGKDYWSAKYKIILLKERKDKKTLAFMRSVFSQFDQYVKLNKKIPPEILTSLTAITEPGRLADSIAANLTLKLSEKQKILECFDIRKRLDLLLNLMESEIDILQVEKRIRGRVKRQMEKSQREYYLNEQVKAIQKELGEQDENADLDELEAKINDAKMTVEAEEKCLSELKKLKLMSPMSAEASVVRTYIETLINLPWHEITKISEDLYSAEESLDNDHYGLEKVKERIVEYLAVQNRVGKLKAPILCLVGPPGVGKTSLGQSIAKSVNRKFIRMALGGVRDEAEIRGHRRTYIGAMPGSIVQKMQKVNVKNPLFLLDEIDKMASDFRGDPSSAMLEVLDPEQNHTFNDHYLEVDYDLSQVMFVATANSLNLPEALVDRMEIIHLSGYTEDEKLEIAKRHLIAKQMKNNGVNSSEIVFKDSAIMDIIRYYTREAGVRNLDREIGSICRKVIKDVTLKKRKARAIINSKSLPKFLGMKKYRFGLAEEHNQIGEVTGLAWTSVGGDLLTIEASSYKGKGKLNYTGQLGDVMKESIQAAMSVTRLRADSLGISDDFHEKLDIHIHVPDGSTPKDGPSAGAAMCTALVSVLTGRKVKAAVAMTGEITLRGEITPIGGLKEKLLAAMRGGIKTVIIPEDNERELSEVPEKIKSKLEIVKVKWIDQVLDIALEK